MAFTVVMPQVAETVTEGTVSRWLKRPGDPVEKYEPLVEVNTDKVDVEIPAPVKGVLKEVLAPEGAVVQVGQALAVIEEAEAAEAIRPETPPIAAAGREEPQAVEEAQRAAAEAGAPAPLEAPAPGRPRATPRVRHLAQELGVDLAQVRGTGPGGRITEEDVRRQAAPRPEAAPERPPAAAPPPAEEERVPLTAVRRTIAQRMAASAFTAPHAWLMMEADVTGLVRLRQALRDEFERVEGVGLTYLPFVVKAVAEGLRRHPYLNASWSEDAIVLKKRINIGIAVATEQGLMVPVVHDADRLSIAGLARAIADLAERARAGRLRLEDVQGGTFTVDNTGVFGSVATVPIIFPGQAAILTSEAIRPQVRVLENEAIAIRQVMNLCLSFDHRILDGHQAAAFVAFVKERLEAIGPETPVY
ncbi:MAG TPA: dihydrolipoamide acetyltransferase family protein [Dehalococcoidia bacterium]|nr:dihydrolipoamide acetyltransferase family protein [Dehalococcoidia bacterium]